MIGDVYRSLLMNAAPEVVAMYHSRISTDEKERVLSEFSKTDSQLRCVLCSSAFSMGEFVLKLFEMFSLDLMLN